MTFGFFMHNLFDITNCYKPKGNLEFYMVVPKKSDKLIHHLMKSDKAKAPIAYTSSEESEFLTLTWDINNGIKLPSYKMERYQELKKKLGKQ